MGISAGSSGTPGGQLLPLGNLSARRSRQDDLFDRRLKLYEINQRQQMAWSQLEYQRRSNERRDEVAQRRLQIAEDAAGKKQLNFRESEDRRRKQGEARIAQDQQQFDTTRQDRLDDDVKDRVSATMGELSKYTYRDNGKAMYGQFASTYNSLMNAKGKMDPTEWRGKLAQLEQEIYDAGLHNFRDMPQTPQTWTDQNTGKTYINMDGKWSLDTSDKEKAATQAEELKNRRSRLDKIVIELRKADAASGNEPKDDATIIQEGIKLLNSIDSGLSGEIGGAVGGAAPGTGTSQPSVSDTTTTAPPAAAGAGAPLLAAPPAQAQPAAAPGVRLDPPPAQQLGLGELETSGVDSDITRSTRPIEYHERGVPEVGLPAVTNAELGDAQRAIAADGKPKPAQAGQAAATAAARKQWDEIKQREKLGQYAEPARQLPGDLVDTGKGVVPADYHESAIADTGIPAVTDDELKNAQRANTAQERAQKKAWRDKQLAGAAQRKAERDAKRDPAAARPKAYKSGARIEMTAEIFGTLPDGFYWYGKDGVRYRKSKGTVVEDAPSPAEYHKNRGKKLSPVGRL